MHWLKSLLASWGLYQAAERGAGSAAQGATWSARAYTGSKMLYYAAVSLFLLTITVLLVLSVWIFRDWGDAAATIHKGRQATQIEAPAPWSAGGGVPYATRDSAAPPEIERLRVLRPKQVEGALTVGGEGWPVVLIRRRTPWFPEMRSPGDAYEVQVVCPDDAPPACQQLPVAFTPRPRPFLEIAPRPLAGAGVYPGVSDSTRAAVYLGADLLRFGPLHAQIGVAGTPGGQQRLAGAPIDLVPGLGLALKESLMLTGGYAWVEGELYLGVAHKF